MRVLIAGATGAIGRPSVRRLRATKHEVFALARSLDSAPALNEIGAEAVIAEALDATAVNTAVGRIRPDAVINELTSLPRHYTPAEMAAAAERDRASFMVPLCARRKKNSATPGAKRVTSTSPNGRATSAASGAQGAIGTA
jgi:nucleoside-diphosphate-sugar epimerase